MILTVIYQICEPSAKKEENLGFQRESYSLIYCGGLLKSCLFTSIECNIPLITLKGIEITHKMCIQFLFYLS